MVRNIFSVFLGVVAVVFIISYPQEVVSLLNIFMQAAVNMAHALKSLVDSTSTHVKAK